MFFFCLIFNDGVWSEAKEGIKINYVNQIK